MANPEHLNILKRGDKAWNAWRKQNPTVRPELTEVNLAGAFLSRANLTKAHLFKTNLTGATNLTQAQLNQAYVDEHTKLPEGLTRPKPCTLR